MADTSSKITIHMVSSLDGFIAKKDGDISWMRSTDSFEEGVALTDEYIAEYLQKIDCYVLGSRTYEHALKLGWVYGDTPVIVLTNRDLPNTRNTVEFYAGEPQKLINEKLEPNYNGIWIGGGAETAKAFIRQGLADEIVVSILPVILGDGTPFFDYVGKEQKLHLTNVTAFKDGMVELSYDIKRD